MCRRFETQIAPSANWMTKSHLLLPSDSGKIAVQIPSLESAGDRDAPPFVCFAPARSTGSSVWPASGSRPSRADDHENIGPALASPLVDHLEQRAKVVGGETRILFLDPAQVPEFPRISPSDAPVARARTVHGFRRALEPRHVASVVTACLTAIELPLEEERKPSSMPSVVAMRPRRLGARQTGCEEVSASATA